MRYLEQLPIWRDANRLVAMIEIAVRYFPHYHKYTLGTDLRRQAMVVCRLVVRAYNAGTGSSQFSPHNLLKKLLNNVLNFQHILPR